MIEFGLVNKNKVSTEAKE